MRREKLPAEATSAPECTAPPAMAGGAVISFVEVARDASRSATAPVPEQDAEIRGVYHPVAIQVADRRIGHPPQREERREVGAVHETVEVEVAARRLAQVEPPVAVVVERARGDVAPVDRAVRVAVGVGAVRELEGVHDHAPERGLLLPLPEELVEAGRRYWEEHAARPGLDAMRMRSRISESEALLDPSGLGGFLVAEWRVG